MWSIKILIHCTIIPNGLFYTVATWYIIMIRDSWRPYMFFLIILEMYLFFFQDERLYTTFEKKKNRHRVGRNFVSLYVLDLLVKWNEWSKQTVAPVTIIFAMWRPMIFFTSSNLKNLMGRLIIRTNRFWLTIMLPRAEEFQWRDAEPCNAFFFTPSF